jgi:hypothetical protein
MSVELARPLTPLSPSVTSAPAATQASFGAKVAGAVHSAWDFIADRPYRVVVPPVMVFCAAAATMVTSMPNLDPENPAGLAAIATGAIAAGIYAAKSLVADPRPPRPPLEPSADSSVQEP